MFKIIRLALFFISFGVSLAYAAPTVAVKNDDARLWASTKGQELLQALANPNQTEKYAQLDKMINEDVNLNYISKFVIGKYAKLMNKEQQTRYSDLFHRYVLSLYKQINLTFDTSAIDFNVDNVIEHPKFTTVTCSVDVGKVINNLDTQKIPVKFKLIRGVNDKIQAVDVEISEVSLVIEYRKQFYQMIKAEDEDINWFLDKFNDKVIANEEAFYKKASM